MVNELQDVQSIPPKICSSCHRYHDEHPRTEERGWPTKRCGSRSDSAGLKRVILPARVSLVLLQTKATPISRALGNPEGPHALASEWVGTHLAQLFGLPTFDIAILELQEGDEIPFPRGGFARPGPAFCSRAERGRPWDGTEDDLKKLNNPEDITRLVVFDTWILNRDRHYPDYEVRKPNRDNVFLSEERASEGRYRLLAIDHTHCFGHQGELNSRVARLDRIQERRIYGLFPEFASFLRRDVLHACRSFLQALDIRSIEGIVQSIPAGWDVDYAARIALTDLIWRRAQYLARNLPSLLEEGLSSPFGIGHVQNGEEDAGI